MEVRGGTSISAVSTTTRRLHRLTDLDALRSRGESPALIDGDVVISYRQLVERIEQRALQLGAGRRLVALRAGNHVETVITYVAALSAGHVVWVCPDDVDGRTIDRYDPDVMVRPAGQVSERHDGSAHLPHDDLAALMNTSGSTGSSKLVRLALDGIEANAMAIASSLDLRSDDVAITSLPLHYCYGLSLVTSHLSVGAAVVLTDTSVVDPCFWDLVDRWQVTTIAGVPHTFELIDRMDGEMLCRPSVRRVTQAGGRLAPKHVRRLAEHGQRCGWDFRVMYGQTEATARMACMRASDALDLPATIGRPIDGGALRLAPVDAAQFPDSWRRDIERGKIGELAYRGPNVMLGYADGPSDLARGRDVEELLTGDIGRRAASGAFEIVGRRHDFVKLFGHRIDLVEVQRRLDDAGFETTVAGDDNGLAVATGGSDSDEVHRFVVDLLGVPRAAVVVLDCDTVPRHSSGKVDRQALLVAVRTTSVVDTVRSTAADRTGLPEGRSGREDRESGVAGVFTDVLGVVTVGPDDTFTSLGGDSLSYVEASIRLEHVLGSVPTGWHLMPVDQLERRRRPASETTSRTRFRRVEASVVIRALGILIIVCTHMRIARLAGGAHALLAVAGYNFARFQLTAVDGPGRLRRGLRTVARVAVPTSIWVGLQMAVVGGYSLGALFLVNNYFGSPWRRDGRWEYWYFEAFVQIFLVLALLFALPVVSRLERRRPMVFAFALLAVSVVVGLRFVEFGDSYNAIFRPHTVLLFVMFGWCAHVATRTAHRVVLSAVLVGATPLYFDRWQQAVMVCLLVGMLIWVPTIAVPGPLAGGIGVIAAASMYIFLVHWQVWPMFTSWLPRPVAFVPTVGVGIATWWGVRRVQREFAARRLS